jgi:phosphoserine phosphatase
MMRTGVLAGETVAAGDVVSDDADMLKKAGKRLAFSPELARDADAAYESNPIKIFEF